LLGRPALDLLGQDVVAAGDIALEEPHAHLGALGVRHRAQRAEADRRAAGDQRRPSDELTTGNVVGVDLLGELANSAIHALPPWRH
jgi:hypothetical protein